MKKILILASGSGSNAENIALFFRKNNSAEVVCIGTNNSKAKVLERADRLGISSFVFSKKQLLEGDVLQTINGFAPDIIVLAGFLLQFPIDIIKQYPQRIINIHPSLLPKFGGKGMYGNNVHKAVLDNNEIETGITIHYVTEHYDDGEIIFQAKTDISNCTNTNQISSKIHDLEMEYFPQVIESLLSKM